MQQRNEMNSGTARAFVSPAPNSYVEALISSVIMFGEGPSKEVTNVKGALRPGTDLIDLMTL